MALFQLFSISGKINLQDRSITTTPHRFQIRNPADETHCINCPRGTIPDIYHENCQHIPEDYLKPESPYAIGAMSFSSLGIVMTFFVVGVFLKYDVFYC